MLALLLTFGCSGGDVEISDVTVAVSEHIGTVATVSFTTSEEATASITYDVVGGTSTTVATTGTQHTAILRSLTPATDVGFTVDAVAGDSSALVDDSFTTGVLPAGMPALTISGDGNDQWMLTSMVGGTAGPLMVAPDGQVVWGYLDERGLDSYRARALLDGSGVIYSAASVSGEPADDSGFVKVAWDGSSEEFIEVPLLAHDFVQLSDGTITAIVVEYRDGSDGEPLRGDKLVEIAPDGTQTDVWSAWDCFDPDVTPGDEPELGWTFVNALDVSPDESAYRISIRNFSALVQIERDTGACTWVLGDDADEMVMGDTNAIVIDGDDFRHEHQFELTGNELVVFDNEGLGFGQSRVIEYEVAFDDGVATEVWSYEPDPPINAFVLGDVKRMDDGDTLITWSVAGQIDRVDADGNVKWTLNSGIGAAFGFMTLSDQAF